MAKGYKEKQDKPRRFYSAAEAAPDPDGGFGVRLDGRPLKTPQGRVLILPTQALAELVAGEWAAQGETLELAGMHATRLANTAVDSIGAAREGSADQIAQYAGSDLLCYFAEAPQALLARQQDQWGPVLDRAEQELALAFVRAAGIVHQSQPEATLARVRGLALELDDFGLAGLAYGTALYGSAVLALAVQRGWISGEAALDLSRLDERFQEEVWGVDAEAAERVDGLRREAQVLGAWMRALAA